MKSLVFSQSFFSKKQNFIWKYVIKICKSIGNWFFDRTLTYKFPKSKYIFGVCMTDLVFTKLFRATCYIIVGPYGN